MKSPYALFEVSWEVCNLVGGIHTVLASKAQKMQQYYGDLYITVGPDLPRLNDSGSEFREEIWAPEFMETLSALNFECRMGRWLVPGEPRTILVNFGKLHQQRDQLLADYWERYGLHSLYGGWDYLEPMFFGQAAGTVIEHLFFRHFKPRNEQVVVHCHEWLSTTALLHLRKAAPEIGTVYTTHATALGRSLANSERDVDLSIQAATDPELNHLAQEMGVSAKHSLEVVSARIADCFTTVSTVAAEECLQILGRKPDLLLLNGYSEEFIDPRQGGTTAVAVQEARLKLLELAELVTGTRYEAADTAVLISSGRYEYRNKGVDLLLDSLGDLNQRIKKKILAFLIYPAGQVGPKRELLSASRKLDFEKTPQVCTHELRDETGDPILQHLARLGLGNRPEQPVHVIFIPIYLDGTDALIRDKYFDLLPGVDLTVFPSLYEPWGYTPLESIALGVPTVTTDMSGFGRWAAEQGPVEQTGVHVLPRRDRSYADAVRDCAELIGDFLDLPFKDYLSLRQAALKTGQNAQWKNWGRAYYKAHALALSQAEKRLAAAAQPATGRPPVSEEPSITAATTRATGKGETRFDPSLHMRSFTVRNRLPSTLAPLRALARNVRWDWDPEARELFTGLEATAWERSDFNPSALLDCVQPGAIQKASQDKSYLERLQRASGRLDAEGKGRASPEIAFFCAEYGITDCLRFYSGGLGILAGDLVKTASDLKLPLCGVGLAYQLGYFRQKIDREGCQENVYLKNDFFGLPMELVADEKGHPVTISIPFPTGPVQVRAWKLIVGNVELYLLDTDFGANRPEDRGITDKLYGGDRAHRLRQEFVLGIGGYHFLKALGLRPSAYHMNEGHSAFLVLARLADLMSEHNLKLDEALELVRHTCIFTTHTPVPAGHDYFAEDLIRPYLAPFQEALRTDWNGIMTLGQPAASEKREFSMTQLCLTGSIRVNAVSKIHGDVSRKMFTKAYPGLFTDEVPVSSITNGVHVPTWVAPAWQRLFSSELGNDWREHLTDESFWAGAIRLKNAQIWNTHTALKKELIGWLKGHVEETFRLRRENPAHLEKAKALLDRDPLLIGFARRFAPYKRAHLLFTDPERLRRVLEKSTSIGHPIVFLYAGKAHPADLKGQNIIKRIIDLSREEAFAGHVLFVENYEMHVARRLVSGCDVWLNTPTRPLEASGTSGMKAAMNGCLNLSVADGWWDEAFDSGNPNGWVIGDTRASTTAPDISPEDFQTREDALRLYSLLEDRILPAFTDRDSDGAPEKWVRMMKQSIASVVPRFSSTRMLKDYERLFYRPAVDDARLLAANGGMELSRIAGLRNLIAKNWAGVTFLDVQTEGLGKDQITVGESARIRVELNHPDLEASHLLVEAVLAHPSPDGNLNSFRALALDLISHSGPNSSWQSALLFDHSGPYSLGIRVRPRDCHTSHPADFPAGFVKWL